MKSMEQSLPDPADNRDEVSLEQLFRTACHGWKVLLLGTVLAACVGAAIAFMLPVYFTARTSLMPPQQAQTGGSAMAAQMGALAAVTGLSAGLKTPEDLYVALLKSRSVSDSLIQKFNLKDRYDEKFVVDVYRKLDKNIRVSADKKSSLITVEVDDTSPQMAADMANVHVEELRKLLGRLAVTEAQQRRVFFESQLNKAKESLVQAEVGVKRAQESSGLASVDAQTQAMIATAAQLRGQIVAREVQLQSLRNFAGPDNPELKRVSTELVSLRSELARLEGVSAPNSDNVTPAGSGKNNRAIDNVRLYRELKFQEAVYGALMQQFQLAKADEARDAPLIQQIDIAAVPEKKSKPSRGLIIVVAALLGFMLALIFVLKNLFLSRST